MVSGDAHMLSYDSGEFNGYGHFPIFQCSSLDKIGSCKNNGWSADPSLKRGQYCQFEIAPHPTNAEVSCFKFEGYHMSNKLMEFNSCDAGFTTNRMKWFDVLKDKYAISETSDLEWWKKDLPD